MFELLKYLTPGNIKTAIDLLKLAPEAIDTLQAIWRSIFEAQDINKKPGDSKEDHQKKKLDHCKNSLANKGLLPTDFEDLNILISANKQLLKKTGVLK